ncbi:MAG: CBS domain-containing protein [Lachnospiraceae bacterium]|nr:CBS domain-containing protein [Lachnospiraceae bacterium]
MYVRDHMTAKPYTVNSDTVISKAMEIMAKNHFHRLPVVDGAGKLIGLVTGGVIEEGSGAKSTSLSIFELNYLLSKTKVSDLMLTDVKTASADEFVEEAAQRMIDNGIAALPVVDADNVVIGIITEKDIFQAFSELLGHKSLGTRFIISCEDKPGFVVGVAKCFADNDCNIETMAVYHSKERGTELVVKATGEISAPDMAKIMTGKGYDLKGVAQTLKDGSVRQYPVEA